MEGAEGGGRCDVCTGRRCGQGIGLIVIEPLHGGAFRVHGNGKRGGAGSLHRVRDLQA